MQNGQQATEYHVGGIAEGLRWKKFEVLDDGFVCLVDVMGNDASIVQAARVSYGEGTKHVSDDRTLIRYLMRKRHTSPFEMAELKFLIRVPMDCWRQWIRHRTANVNEYSTRYSEAIDSMQKTPDDEWRTQSKSNKQGSGDRIPEMLQDVEDSVGLPDGFRSGIQLSSSEIELHKQARKVYQERLDAGVAREQARKDLPLSTYTEAYWKIDLHNLLHFLGLRMDSHAQHEIRQYATTIGEQIVKPLFPVAWEAFEDYRLGGMFLTRLEIDAIQWLQEIQRNDIGGFANPKDAIAGVGQWFQNNRERNECIEKLKNLGIL